MIEISWIILLMFMWFNTDFFISYSKLFKLQNIFKISNWELYRQTNPKIKYLEYLRLKHTSFITKLISCKPCLNFWICLFICLLFGSIFLFPLYYLVSYIIYNIINKFIL
jgi:hypothetical protein